MSVSVLTLWCFSQRLTAVLVTVSTHFCKKNEPGGKLRPPDALEQLGRTNSTWLAAFSDLTVRAVSLCVVEAAVQRCCQVTVVQRASRADRGGHACLKATCHNKVEELHGEMIED